MPPVIQGLFEEFAMSCTKMGFTLAAVVLGAAPLQAATLSLRPTGAATGTALILAPQAEGSFDIVLGLDDGESAEFVTLFLDISGDASAVEVFDLETDVPVPPAVFGRVSPLDQELPLAAGAGFSVGDYALLLSDAALMGPGEFVLERVLVRGVSLGEVSVRYAAGDFTAAIDDVDSVPIEAVVSTTPLVIRVQESTTDGGPRPTVRACGAGGAMALLLGVIGLSGLSRRNRGRSRRE
jgi:hypothetical protein